MARKSQKSPGEQRQEKNQRNLYGAKSLLGWTALEHLLEFVKFEESEQPETASVNPETKTIFVNPFREVHSDKEWAAIIGHLLLHLGLNHAGLCNGRDPLLWNFACDEALEKILPQFGLPPLHSIQGAFDESSEAAIYDAMTELRRTKTTNAIPTRTLAGGGRPDILGIGRVSPFQRDYERCLADGIRQMIEKAIADTAREFDADVPNLWQPAERAKRWVMNELPLLGALASQITIIARADLCERMDIAVAAVNGNLMEMYFHPKWNLTQPELLFVYVHELLHVALMHHSRAQGRDHELWNIACDFVINGWLVEMGVGQMPTIGALYDPRLAGMSAETVYDLIVKEPKPYLKLRGFRGKLGDVLLDAPNRRIYKDDVTTIDDLIHRCMATGMACQGRGTVPAGLLEEIRSLYSLLRFLGMLPLPRWMDAHVPALRDPLRTYARASRRQASTPDIPRPARYIPQEWKDAHTFGVVLDTSGSMDRELLGRALGAIASYAEARDVTAVRLVLCDAAPYDRGIVEPSELRGIYSVQGRGGTVLAARDQFPIGSRGFSAERPDHDHHGWVVRGRTHCAA